MQKVEDVFDDDDDDEDDDVQIYSCNYSAIVL